MGKSEISKLISTALKNLDVKISEKEIEEKIETPPSQDLGDFAFPCFFLSKILKQPPNEIALQLRSKIKKIPSGFSDIQTQGPYLNFFVDRTQLARDLILEILGQKEEFGKVTNTYPKTELIEFSQPNTHKAFHVGHIRGTSIGESLSRISEFTGNKVIRANYSGDTGMHIAKWIWCYTKYHAKEKLKDDESWIASIYVDAVKRLTKNEKLQKQVDGVNRKIETRTDKKINDLWEKTRKLSIDSWKKIYKELNTHFDVHYFESQVELPGKEIALKLLEKGIAQKSDDAVIMDLKEFGLSVWVLLRKDGTVLYSSKDLALAEKKVEDFNADNYLVLVADEQKLHFQQLKKTLELMKFSKTENYNFETFGLVRLPTGKMSSRTGDNILYSDFMNELTSYAKKQIAKREKLSAKEIENRALKISIAAIKYSMLKQDPNKIIVFAKEDALNFEGNTGPYLLYSYARANSILKKTKSKNIKFSVGKLEEKEIELIKKLSDFQKTIIDAYSHSNPALIANYTYQLSQTFNEFYHSCPVINSEKENFRLRIVECFKIVLKNSLYLLGIDVLEKM